MQTKFNINPSEKAKQFLTLSGVPAGLLAPFRVDLGKLFTAFNAGGKTTKIITHKQQLQTFEYICSTERTFVAMLCSQQYYQQARQVAMLIYWAHLQRSLNATGFQLPHWHNPSLNYENNLLREYKQGEYASPLLLVLDNIYADMPNIKTDKVSDILQTLGDRPRLLIYRGAEPQQFCINKFGVRPNFILQIGPTRSAGEKPRIQL